MTQALADPAPGGSAKPMSLRVLLTLAAASAGVVYGDIGTSPLYAFKESISHLGGDGPLHAPDVIGVVSLMFWTLMVIVTLKYVLVLMRFDNRGEGGTLSLMALVQKAAKAPGRGGRAITLIGMLGAGLFFGDAVLTPAISVLSAVEGVKVIEAVGDRLDPFIAPIALAILLGLFAVQSRGTGKVGRWFGPICIVWFGVLAALGLASIARAPEVLAALNPAEGLSVLVRHPGAAAAILGSVFLTVTGAEALYADMGHFGRKPIQLTWLALVFPCLTLNYLGQGALVLNAAEAADNPFFRLAPEWFQIPLVVLATAATVIASQAVISGAFSMTHQAVQLGLLPRIRLLETSEHHEGQIYVPAINWLLMVGVAVLVLAFGSSSALASAYGMSVVGAMITSSVLAVVAIHRLKGRPIWVALAAFAPFLALEGAFTAANLAKVAHGGWLPLVLAACVIAVMVTWVRGSRRLAQAEARGVQVADVAAMLADRPPLRARGAAVYLTTDLVHAPASLLHNLKHNQVLHEQVILLHVQPVRRPRVGDHERVAVRELAPGFTGVTLSYGFMETPDVTQGLALARRHGLKLDIMRTSFFLSRRSLLPRHGRGFRALQDLLFVFLSRNALRAADYFRIPPSRVVELGAQVTL